MSIALPLGNNWSKRSPTLCLTQHHLHTLDLFWARFFVRVQLTSLLLISPGLWSSMQWATHLYIWQNFHQCRQFLVWNELVRTKVLLQFNFNKRMHFVICDQSLYSVSRSLGGHNLIHNLFLFLKQCITIYTWLTDQWRECFFYIIFYSLTERHKYWWAFYRDANGWILLHREW